MRMSWTSFNARIKRHRVQAECIGLSVTAVVVAIAVGTLARRRAVPIQAEVSRLRSANREVANFRAAFRAASRSGDEILVPDSLAVALPRGARMSLAQQVADRAEALGLADVRVRFAGSDSAAAPEEPDLVGTSVAVADYTITVDCRGALAPVLSLIERLPPSVALQRLTASRTAVSTRYHLVLAVFEAKEPRQHG